MSLTSIIKGILNIQKKIDLKTLPSQGIFYNDGFEIYIKKANLEDIIEYEYDYDEEQLGSVISKIKKIVEKNITITPPNTYNNVKSIDIVFLFLEIVKFTNNKPINIPFFNDLLAKEEHIKFESTNFNYFQLDEKILEKYDSETKEFNFEGFKYSVPSIGVENALTQFLISKSLTKNSEAYNTYSYDFLYFLGHKSFLNFDEIENLIQIFNNDIDEQDRNKIEKIVKKLSVIGKYSLKKDSQIIDVTAKINLSNIWK
jgi:hypothetical protein